MPITATALLRIPNLKAPPGMRAELLADATLLHTAAPFASEPEQLGALLAGVLGDLLEQHDDPRGVLFLPSVAAPKGKSYAEVVSEVGEGGVWAPLSALDQESAGFALPDGLGALSAMFSSMVEHMPPSVLAAAEAAARGDAAALQSVSQQVAAMLGQSEAQLAGLTSLLGPAGLDFSSPALQQLLPKLGEELARDPEKLHQLAAQLFGQGALPPEDDDE